MPLPDLSSALKQAYDKADKQYANKYNETCQVCGRKNLYPTIEWAKTQNQYRWMRAEEPIIVRYCYYCRSIRKNQLTPEQ